MKAAKQTALIRFIGCVILAANAIAFWPSIFGKVFLALAIVNFLLAASWLWIDAQRRKL